MFVWLIQSTPFRDVFHSFGLLNSSIATALTITVSSICPNKYYLSLITEANRPRIDGKKSLLLYLLPGYEFTKVKIRFLEFSHETANREIEDNKE